VPALSITIIIAACALPAFPGPLGAPTVPPGCVRCHNITLYLCVQGIPPAALMRVPEGPLRCLITTCIAQCPTKRPTALQLLKHEWFDSLRTAGAGGSVCIPKTNCHCTMPAAAAAAAAEISIAAHAVLCSTIRCSDTALCDSATWCCCLDAQASDSPRHLRIGVTCISTPFGSCSSQQALASHSIGRHGGSSCSSGSRSESSGGSCGDAGLRTSGGRGSSVGGVSSIASAAVRSINASNTALSPRCCLAQSLESVDVSAAAAAAGAGSGVVLSCSGSHTPVTISATQQTGCDCAGQQTAPAVLAAMCPTIEGSQADEVRNQAQG
jgi:uncharacterized membrane protein YgcG